MKSDFSSDTDSSSENTYSSSEEDSDNVTFYCWIVYFAGSYKNDQQDAIRSAYFGN